MKNLEVRRDSNSQSGSSLESVGVHSLTLSYTLESMKCDSQASFLARTLTNPCFGHKPKVRVAIMELRTHPRTWSEMSECVIWFIVLANTYTWWLLHIFLSCNYACRLDETLNWFLTCVLNYTCNCFHKIGIVPWALFLVYLKTIVQ